MTIASRLRRADLLFSRLRRQLAVAVCPFSSRAEYDASSNVSGPHLPVLIVGAGPVGLVLSMLLTKFGTPLADYNCLPLCCRVKNANGFGFGLGFGPIGILFI